MSLLEISLITIAVLVVLVPILTFVVSVRISAHRASVSGKTAVQARAGRDVTQAGRDIVQASYTSIDTQFIQTLHQFLADGEELATASNLATFEQQVRELWSSALHEVRAVSLYGRPFMPTESDLVQLAARGVDLKVILVDPESAAAADVALTKCRFSRSLDHYAVLAESLNIIALNPDMIRRRIHEEVDDTLRLLTAVKVQQPSAKIFVKFIEFLPTWKGTVVDACRGVYLIYDIPRMDVPFRYCARADIVTYYLDRYFQPYWLAGKEVPV